MAEYIDAAVEAFISSDASIAMFDRQSLTKEGTWEREDSVPVMGLVKRFKTYDTLVKPDGTLILPLHREDSAELSGKYIEFRPGGLADTFVYFDSDKGKLSRISPNLLGKTYIAQYLRFWTKQNEPDSVPSYTKTGSKSLLSSSPLIEMDPSTEEDFFTGLRSFVSEQMDAERNEVRTRYRDHPLNRVTSDIGGTSELVYIGQRDTEHYTDVLTFGVATDNKNRKSYTDITKDCGIFPRAEAILGLNSSSSSTNETSTPLPVEATVAFTRGQYVGLSLHSPSEFDLDQLESVLSDSRNLFCVVPLLNRVPYELELRGINAVQQHERKRNVLCGHRTLEFQPSFAMEFDWSTTQLNEFQQQASERALRARDVFCIHGPPGTGKTRTLNTIIKTAASNGLRVLACAHSNQAVDNLLAGNSTSESPDSDSLHAAAVEDEIKVSRVGSNSAHPVVNNHYTWMDEATADVVCATTNAADEFSVDEFDLAVVDEATQASIPATMVPYAAAKRLVLAGDHKQLPPYGSNELEQGEMHISLFEHLLEQYDEYLTTLLRRQYRMNERIAEFPNTAFYDGKLETDDWNRSWKIDGFAPIDGFDIAEPEGRTRSKSYKNEREAQVAAEEAQKLLENGVDPHDVGIITPYTGQIGTIYRALSRLDIDTQPIKVDTIDSFQGGERDAIIISFVRSNEYNNAGFLTFPDEGARRLNVALTRARKRLVVVGDFETLGSYSEIRTPNTSCADLYSSLFTYLSELDVVHTN